MSSRLSIQHFISPTEPLGVQVGDEWMNPTANTLQKRTLVSGNVGWSPIITTISNVPNSSLANSSVTINGTTIPLGSSTSLAAGATVADDTTTNATRYIMLGSITSGSYTAASVSSTKLYFNPSTGTTYSTLFQSLSDETQKTNIIKIENATDTIKQIDGFEFDWSENGNKSAGVIAQQLEKILPWLVSENEGIKSVNYSGLIAYLIQSNKELADRVEKLENR